MPCTECVIPEQMFMACGTACPAVCREERPMFCAAMCVSECQCPPGMFLDRTQNQCVTDCPTEITPTTEVDPTTSGTGFPFLLFQSDSFSYIYAL